MPRRGGVPWRKKKPPEGGLKGGGKHLRRYHHSSVGIPTLTKRYTGYHMGDITQMADYVTREQHDYAHDERRHELRRESDRIDRLRLDCDELRVIVVGKTGANGLSSKVSHLTGAVSRFERILYWIGMLMASTVVGVVARTWPD